jgi:hypothetical protein
MQDKERNMSKKALSWGVVVLLMMAGGVGAVSEPFENHGDLFPYGFEKLTGYDEIEIGYDVNGEIHKIIFYHEGRRTIGTSVYSDTVFYNEYGQITLFTTQGYKNGKFTQNVYNSSEIRRKKIENDPTYGYIDEDGIPVAYEHQWYDITSRKSIKSPPPPTPNPLEVELNQTKQKLQETETKLAAINKTTEEQKVKLVTVNQTAKETEARLSWLETMVNHILDWIYNNFGVDLHGL